MSDEADTLKIASSGLSAEIALIGAELRNLADAEGRRLQWDGDPAVWNGRAPILFPIVGTLAGGRYRLDEREYAMPRHGFARHARFVVVAHDDHAAVLRLEASATTRAMYPFDFRLDLAYTLVATELRVVATIANLDDRSMPASFGFHPAFRLPLPYDQPRDDHTIRFEHDEPAPIRQLDGDGLLRSMPIPTPIVGDQLALRDGLFTHDALIFDALTSRRVTYGASHGPRLEIAFEGLPMLGVWTRPGAQYVCIEPWHGIADAAGDAGTFRDKPGMLEIAPGAVHELVMTVGLQHGVSAV